MSEWVKKQLSQLALLSKGQQMAKIHLEKEGDYYVLNGGQNPSGYLNKWNTEADTISISEGGNSCGYVAYNSTRFWSGGHNYALKNLSKEICLLYLYEYLKFKEPDIMRLRVGSGLPNIQKKELSKVQIQFSTNKQEQEKIAEILTTIDIAIDKTTAIIEKYKAIKEGLLQDLLTNGIDENGNIRSPKTHKYKLSPLGMIPVEWDVDKIEHLFKLRARIGWQGLRSVEFIDEGPYLVTGTDSDNGRLDWDNCYHVSLERYFQDVGIKLKNDDLLITKDGTIGKTAMVKDCPHQVTLNSGVFVIRPINQKTTTDYLYYLLSDRSFALFIQNNLTGSTIKHLNQAVLYKMQIKRPDRNEQIRITQILFAVDEKIDLEYTHQRKLLQIKQGLMQDLLTHKVAVDALL